MFERVVSSVVLLRDDRGSSLDPQGQVDSVECITIQLCYIGTVPVTYLLYLMTMIENVSAM